MIWTINVYIDKEKNFQKENSGGNKKKLETGMKKMHMDVKTFT